MPFVLFDTESNLYPIREWSRVGSVTPEAVLHYTLARNAINAASLMNTSRTLPPGMKAGDHRHYRERPKMVVRSLDTAGNVLGEIEAPAVFINVSL